MLPLRAHRRPAPARHRHPQQWRVLCAAVALMLLIPVALSGAVGAFVPQVAAHPAPPAPERSDQHANQYADQRAIGTAQTGIEIAIDSSTVTEGDDPLPRTPMIFTVTVTGTISTAITIDYQTQDFTAVAGTQYDAISGTLTFGPDAATTRTQTIQVATIGNRLFSGTNRTFFVDISSPDSVTIVQPRGTGTIIDNEAQPAISISDLFVTERAQGQNDVGFFDISLSNASEFVITVTYRLGPCDPAANNCATIGEDFQMTPTGVLTFTGGDTVQRIQATILGDDRPERDEVFFVELANSTGQSTIADGNGTGTIRDTDQPVAQFTEAVYSFTEDQGTVQITVTLNFPHYLPVSLLYFTEEDTATANQDYTTIPPTRLNFELDPVTQETTTTATLDLTIRNDNLQEEQEEFRLFITTDSSSNAVIGTPGLARVVIIDDDNNPTLSAIDLTVGEGDSGDMRPANFRVTLSPASIEPITVDYTVTDGTATAGSDYTIAASSGTLTFEPNSTTQNVPLTILGDDLDEANETFTITLSNPQNAIISAEASQATAIIEDDDGPTIVLSSRVYTVTESAGQATIAVELDAPSPDLVTVDYFTREMSALDGIDYRGVSGRLTFNPNTPRLTFDVEIFDDLLLEADETLELELRDPTSATLGDIVTATLVIADDESISSVGFTTPQITVTEGITTPVVISVTARVSLPNRAIAVTVGNQGGTAVADADYTFITQTLRFDPIPAITDTFIFTPVNVVKPITLTILNDDTFENTEQFELILLDPQEARLVSSTPFTLTILDDEPPPERTYIPFLAGALPTVAFSAPLYTIPEDASTAIITVTISTPPIREVTVDYRTAGISAQPGSDYLTATGTLTFPVGTTESQQFLVRIIDDTEQEIDESLVLTLGNLQGNAQIIQAASTLQILDDDQPFPGRSNGAAAPVGSAHPWDIFGSSWLTDLNRPRLPARSTARDAPSGPPTR